MIYLRASKDFMYHLDFVTKKGKPYAKYYNIKVGQLLTMCEAIQKFDLTLNDIFRRYPLEVIRINLRHTERITCDYLYSGRFVKSEYLDSITIVKQ